LQTRLPHKRVIRPLCVTLSTGYHVRFRAASCPALILRHLGDNGFDAWRNRTTHGATERRMAQPNDADVIIVGAGGSGLAAAARCVELGVSVVVLEKQPKIGGTTGIAVGSFTANRTLHQRRADISDSVDAHAEDAGKFASPEIESRNNELLRRYFLSHTSATLQWLTDMGLTFHGPSPEPPNRCPRMHNVIPNAKAYIATLQSKVLAGGGRIRCNAPVVEMVRHGNRVSGLVAMVEGERKTFRAAMGIMLAAGDYANSADLIQRFKGDAFAAIEGINPHVTGDGHRLAEQAGAQLMNMQTQKRGQVQLLTPRVRCSSFRACPEWPGTLPVDWFITCSIVAWDGSNCSLATTTTSPLSASLSRRLRNARCAS